MEISLEDFHGDIFGNVETYHGYFYSGTCLNRASFIFTPAFGIEIDGALKGIADFIELTKHFSMLGKTGEISKRTHIPSSIAPLNQLALGKNQLCRLASCSQNSINLYSKLEALNQLGVFLSLLFI